MVLVGRVPGNFPGSWKAWGEFRRLTMRGLALAADQPQNGRLAAARRPHQRGHLAARHGQRNVVQNDALAITEGEIAQFDERFRLGVGHEQRLKSQRPGNARPIAHTGLPQPRLALGGAGAAIPWALGDGRSHQAELEICDLPASNQPLRYVGTTVEPKMNS